MSCLVVGHNLEMRVGIICLRGICQSGLYVAKNNTVNPPVSKLIELQGHLDTGKT